LCLKRISWGGWGGRCKSGIMSHITYTPLAKSGVGGVTPANVCKNLLARLLTRLAHGEDVDDT